MNKKKLCAILVLGALLSGGCGSGFRHNAGAGTGDAPGPRVMENGIIFTFLSPKATSVCIAGDFNNWSMTSDPLFDREGTGIWTILLPLPPGRYEYKFVVDLEKWVADPGNAESIDDGFGGFNSLLIVE